MIEFGKTLREAREQKGLTISQIAEKTHLLPQIVEDLEREDFHRISAPIYGRGFIKLYCETVGLEAKPLVDEFMAITSGEREPAIRMREVAPVADEAPAEPAPPPPPPAPVYTQPELGDAGMGSGQDARQETRDARQETRDASGDVGLRTQAEAPDLRRELPDARLETPRQYHPDYARARSPLPPNLGRLAILAGGAIAIIALLVWGGRALYRVAMGIGVGDATAEAVPAQPEPEAATGKQTAEKPAKQNAKDAEKTAKQKAKDAGGDAKQKAKDAKPKAKDVQPKAKSTRTPKPVKPLYID